MDAPDPRESKRAIARVFSRTSISHDTVGTPLFAELGSSLVDAVDLHAGDRILDVAAGTGATSFPAARRVGAEGRVIAVDLATGMAERLRDAIASGGVLNAAVAVADAEDLPFADRSFDVVLCGLGLFFFPHAGRALREFRRVLRPGGALAVSTFAAAGQASLARIRQRIFAHMPTPPARERSVEFDEPGQLQEALGGAGFVDVVVEEAPLELVLPGFGAWWAWVWSMEFRHYLEQLDPQALATFRRAAAEGLAADPEAPEIRMRMDALLTRARTPARSSE